MGRSTTTHTLLTSEAALAADHEAVSALREELQLLPWLEEQTLRTVAQLGEW